VTQTRPNERPDPTGESRNNDPWEFLRSFLSETFARNASEESNPTENWNQLPPPRVLLAHADDIRRSGLAWELGAGGCCVIEVEDGAELLDYLDGREPWAPLPRPDIIVAELDMPGFGGLEAARLLRERGDHTPIIFINVPSAPSSALAAARLPGTHLVEGEIEGGVLRAAVERALRH
jgi:CheY-like chemotaxis protein